VIYSKWSIQANKQASNQANIHTHGCNEVTLVWGSLRLAPIMIVNWSIQIHKNKEVRMKTVISNVTRHCHNKTGGLSNKKNNKHRLTATITEWRNGHSLPPDIHWATAYMECHGKPSFKQ